MFLRAMTVVLLATFAPMTSALAQETTAPEAAAFDPAAYDLERGKVVYEKVGICLQCHGWDGNGLGRNPRSQGEAARLRESALTPEQLREVVACGRP